MTATAISPAAVYELVRALAEKAGAEFSEDSGSEFADGRPAVFFTLSSPDDFSKDTEDAAWAWTDEKGTAFLDEVRDALKAIGLFAFTDLAPKASWGSSMNCENGTAAFSYRIGVSVEASTPTGGYYDSL